MESEVVNILSDAKRDMRGVVGQTLTKLAEFLASDDEGTLPLVILSLEAAQEGIEHYQGLKRRATEAIAAGPIKAIPFRASEVSKN